jgi:hypothetical protein
MWLRRRRYLVHAGRCRPCASELLARVSSKAVSDVTYGDVPHCIMAIISRILAQWRESDAVVESEATEFEWFEEFRNALGLLGNESSARGGILSRREVRDARRCLVDVVRLLFDVRLDGVVRRHIGWCRWLLLVV